MAADMPTSITGKFPLWQASRPRVISSRRQDILFIWRVLFSVRVSSSGLSAALCSALLGVCLWPCLETAENSTRLWNHKPSNPVRVSVWLVSWLSVVIIILLSAEIHRPSKQKTSYIVISSLLAALWFCPPAADGGSDWSWAEEEGGRALIADRRAGRSFSPPSSEQQKVRAPSESQWEPVAFWLHVNRLQEFKRFHRG